MRSCGVNTRATATGLANSLRAVPRLRLFFRLSAVIAAGIGVFFASMALTIWIHTDSAVGATSLIGTQPIDAITTTSTTILTSTNPVVVATTTPSTHSVATTTTVEILTRSRLAPLPELDDVFAPLSELDTLLAVPIRLPAELEFDQGELVADGVIDVRGYTIHVDHVGQCNAGQDQDDSNTNDSANDESSLTTRCRIATFTARQSSLSSPTLGNRGTAVPLPNGLTGRFSDGTCGQGCNNAFITWIEDGVRYSVGSKEISGSDVLDLAWRSIDRSLPSPTGPEVCGPGNPKHAGQVTNVLSTEVATGEVIYWVAVCSGLGIDVEIMSEPGVMAWSDVDRNGVHDVVVTHANGTSSVFAVEENQPRAVVDLGTSERLAVGMLTCISIDGQTVAIDAATNERLNFISPLTASRLPLTPDQVNLPHFTC